MATCSGPAAACRPNAGPRPPTAGTYVPAVRYPHPSAAGITSTGTASNPVAASARSTSTPFAALCAGPSRRCHWQPPHRSKYGHGGDTRRDERWTSVTRRPRKPLSRHSRSSTSARSPGTASATAMVHGPRCASAFRSADMPSNMTRTRVPKTNVTASRRSCQRHRTPAWCRVPRFLPGRADSPGRQSYVCLVGILKSVAQPSQ